MKKLILLFLIFAGVQTASAQHSRWSRAPRYDVSWGLLAGVNTPTVESLTQNVSIKNNIGWHLGMFTSINYRNYAIEPQLLYVRQSYEVRSSTGESYDLKSNRLDVPVLFSLRVLEPFRINVGPVFSLLNDGKLKSGKDLLDMGGLHPTISYAIGAGLNLGEVIVDFRYNGSFSNKGSMSIGEQLTFDTRTSSIAMSVGILF